MTTEQHYDYIDNVADLNTLVENLRNEPWIVLDTEFIREKHYYAELCLVQIATPTQLACIDPLAIEDLSAFGDILFNPDITKIYHAAFQDQEIFYQMFGKVPAPIFDTQLAAAVLGIGDQIGYARLIQDQLGVQLEKSQSRTNWAQRPLNDKQIHYAIDDVFYLRDAYPKLLQQLETLGRQDWLTPDFEHLSCADTFEPDIANLWKKVKGSQRLRPRQLSILRELTTWREQKAIDKNLPRRWITSDDLLVEIAQNAPQKPDEFSSFRGLKEKNPHIKDWITCVKKGLAVPKESWPRHPKFTKPTEQQSILIDLLMLVVRYQGAKHNISPALIAGKKRIEKMLLAGDTQLGNDWRGHLVNAAFTGILNGTTSVSVTDDNTVILNSNH